MRVDNVEGTTSRCSCWRRLGLHVIHVVWITKLGWEHWLADFYNWVLIWIVFSSTSSQCACYSDWQCEP